MDVTAVSTNSRNDLFRRAANIAAFVAVIVVNVLATTLPLNGLSTGEISDSYPSLFTPAGYVFSIWGLIYLLLAAFVVYQALPQQRSNPRLERLGYLFVLSCAFNIAWLFAWHYLQVPLTLLLMLGLLVSLIYCYNRLEIGQGEVGRAESLAVRLPFSIYLGWITVATVVNVSVFFIDLGYTGGWLAPFWAAVALTAATLIGLTMLRRRSDVPFVLVVVWAFFGIAAAQWGSEALLVLLAVAAALLLLAAVAQRVLGGGSVRI